MNRLLIAAEELDAEQRVTLTDRRGRHLQRVLKVAVGDRVRAGILDGPRGAAIVEAMAVNGDDLRTTLRLDCTEAVPRPSIDLLLALPRPKVLKRLWAQLAAMGVGRIILVNASRVEHNYFATHWIDARYYRPLLIEGLEQAGDTLLPEVRIERRFRPCIEDTLGEYAHGKRWVAHPERAPEVATPAGVHGRRRQVGLVAPLAAPGATGARRLLAVGPEGGWIPFELDLLIQNGFQPFSLGARTLRTDTACIALLAAMQERMNERAKA